jgi:hypothetical protein
MKHSISILAFLLVTFLGNAQDKFFTKTGKIQFDATSKNSPENIIGKNRSVTAVLDSKSGALQFSLLMKGFTFEKALMEEHFNENYVESEKYPKSEFKGVVVNNSEINYSKEGTYTAKVKGSLTIHGIAKEVEASGKIIIKEGKPTIKASFSVVLADYNVSVPTVVSDKLAKNATIDIDCALEVLPAKK